MIDAHAFLEALAVVLGTAGVTTVLFQRLRLPVVLGYILAGFLVGPSISVPLVADREVVRAVSELGVILLMFALGLEFSVRKLLRVGPLAGISAVIESSIMLWLGYLLGRAFGWSTMESLFTGAVVAVSSTTIVAKAFDEQKIRGKLRDLVVGILVVEDLIAVLLMAVLTAVASGDGLSTATVARSSAELAGFLVALVIVGLLVVPRTVRAIHRLGSPETLVVGSMGLCFAVALLAHSLDYSVALGAFLAGSLVAESGLEQEIERLVHPIRDMFAAVFFVSVGMLIDPALIAEHWPAIAALTGLVVGGKIVGVTSGAFLAGNGTRTSLQAGMSLAQIGEFSFIIAGLGLSLGATGSFLYPVAVAVSAITAFTTPWLIRGSDRAVNFVDRKLPRPLQTFASLYGRWLEQIRGASTSRGARAAIRHLAGRLFIDATLLASIVIGAALGADQAAALLSDRLGVPGGLGRALFVAAAVAIASPFGIGVFRLARQLGSQLAEAALPAPRAGDLDRAAAPRRALVLTIQLAVVLTVFSPMAALTNPFLPGPAAPLALAAVLVVMGVAFWRSATNLQGHVRAGAEIIGKALEAQTREGPTTEPQPLPRVDELLPGLGAPVSVVVEPHSPAAGHSLAELELRGRTGATVLAITRPGGGVTIPAATEVLRAGDVLALVGTEAALAAAEALLRPPQAPPEAAAEPA